MNFLKGAFAIGALCLTGPIALAAEVMGSRMGPVEIQIKGGGTMEVDAVWVETAPERVTVVLHGGPARVLQAWELEEGEDAVYEPLKVSMDVSAGDFRLSSSSTSSPCSMAPMMAIEGLMEIYGGSPRVELDRPLAVSAIGGPIDSLTVSRSDGVSLELVMGAQSKSLSEKFAKWESALPAYEMPVFEEQEAVNPFSDMLFDDDNE